MVEYIPILTTVIALIFGVILYRHLKMKFSTYMLWWFIGVVTYGIGTLTESINVLFGWSVINFKLWYIFGAFLGGFPLAQGTVYLLMKKKTANTLTAIFLLIIAVGSVLVLLSPTTFPENQKLSGTALNWAEVRYVSPLINIYSFIFLFGGAVYSAINYFRVPTGKSRFSGNILIAIGALLPGIGGSFTRAGYVEVLYVTELVGLLFIYFGYSIIKNYRSDSIHENQKSVATG